MTKKTYNSILKKIGIVMIVMFCVTPVTTHIDSYAAAEVAQMKRTTPNCDFDVKTKYLSSIPENSSIYINNQIISPNASSYIDLSPYLDKSDYYNIMIVANGSGSYADSEPQIIHVQKPDVPKAVFDGASENLYALSNGMEYSLDGGHSWIPVTGGATSVKLTDAQIDMAATYGYICVKQTVPTESEIEYVFAGRMPQPTGVWGAANTMYGLNGDIEYRHENLNNWTTATGSQVSGLIPGMYKVRTKAKNHNASSVTIDVYVPSNGGYKPNTTPTQPTYELRQEATPNAIFNGHALILGGINGCRISFDGGRSFTDTQYLDKIQLKLKQINPDYGIQIYRPGNGYTTTDSSKQVITVYQQHSPSNVKASHKTAESSGKIKNVDSSMQYKKKGDDFWTDVPSDRSSINVKPGTYYVRCHGYGDVLPSKSVTVEVKDKTKDQEYYIFQD